MTKMETNIFTFRTISPKGVVIIQQPLQKGNEGQLLCCLHLNAPASIKTSVFIPKTNFKVVQALSFCLHLAFSLSPTHTSLYGIPMSLLFPFQREESGLKRMSPKNTDKEREKKKQGSGKSNPLRGFTVPSRPDLHYSVLALAP